MQIQNVQSPSFQSKTFISPKIQKKLNRLVYKMNKSTIYQDEPTLFGAKILAGVHTEKGAVYNTADNAIVHINDKISVYIDKENGEVKKVKKPLFASLKNIILKCEQTIYEANKNKNQ